jgi:phage host-nuclease inhibitor protein Gam
MKTRNAKKVNGEVTIAQFEDAMEKYASAEKKEAEINKSIEADVNEVLEKYESELLTLAQGKCIAFEMAQAYCVNNKETLFGKRRSIGTLHGVAGFRLGTPRLKTVKRR